MVWQNIHIKVFFKIKPCQQLDFLTSYLNILNWFMLKKKLTINYVHSIFQNCTDLYLQAIDF